MNTLKLWGNGSVTLPKRWRDRYPTTLFLVEETKDGYLLIKPLVDAEYYENDDGAFGVRFPTGMAAEELISVVENVGGSTPKKKIKKRNSRN